MDQAENNSSPYIPAVSDLMRRMSLNSMTSSASSPTCGQAPQLTTMYESHHQQQQSQVPSRVVKEAAGFKQTLLDRLNQQRRKSVENAASTVCDMVITTEGQTFHVHKCIMIASCDFFAAMERSGMQETRQTCIELKSVSALGLETLIDFIYTGELRLDMNNIEDVLQAVFHLQVQYAIKLCEEFICEQLNESNCIDMLNLVDMFSMHGVKDTIYLYILRNFDRLVANDQYKRFSFEQMCTFIQSNKLKLYPEIKVFNACIAWLKSYLDSMPSTTSDARINNMYELLQHVRFHTMKPDEFCKQAAKNDMIQDAIVADKSDERFQRLITEGYEYFAMPGRQFLCTSPRSTIRNEPVMVCVNESMYILNKKEESWQYLCQSQATSKILSQKFVVVNNFLYACGGYSETKRETCNKCYRFDPRNGQWKEIASMNEKRQFFTLAASNDCIVAVGGVYGSIGNFYATFPIKSPLEYFSIEKDEWSSFEDCEVPVLKWPGACIFSRDNGDTSKKVFIVGGKLTTKNCLSQQSFIVDLETNKTTVCDPPLTIRFNPSVFYDSSQDKIILFAGEDEKYRLAPCIETFDLTTLQWTEIATIPISLSYQCISSTSMVNSKINYLIEEHDGPFSESYVLRSASFDLITKSFEEDVKLPRPSTLASKWCSLIFPNEFLEKYQTISNDNSSKSNRYYEKMFY